MREYNVEHPNGVDRGPRTLFARSLRGVGASFADESVVTAIPGRFGGGKTEGSNIGFNRRVARKPQVENR